MNLATLLLTIIRVVRREPVLRKRRISSFQLEILTKFRTMSHPVLLLIAQSAGKPAAVYHLSINNIL